ncbi:MAG TPA: hypothetical protein DDZ89_14700, partial [Clostridiales bacterium]|nr:hypothetical protein [Clostridiales bacterium]
WAHSIIMKGTGYGFHWGDNSFEQVPLQIPASNIYQVSAGYYFSHVILKDGSVTGWGDNSFGQLKIPENLGTVCVISAGGYHTLALNTEFEVTAWGSNHYNQCTVPEGLGPVIGIAAGGNHSLALKKDGTVTAWGDNYFGQCDVPEGLQGVIAVAAGDKHSLALKKDGTVVAWGDNSLNQTDIPEGLKDVLFVKAGYGHSLAIKSDGTLVAWGDNGRGQCDVPENLTNVAAVAGGRDFTIAMEKDGTLHAFGDNTKGQCDFNQAANPPILRDTSMERKNRFLDITFNKGVYGDTEGAPVTLNNFVIEYMANDDSEDAVKLTVLSLKTCDSEVESQASDLIGGESMIRAFFKVEGRPKGIETIELNVNKNKKIFDIYGVNVNENTTTGKINLIRPYDDIEQTSSSVGWSYYKPTYFNYYDIDGNLIREVRNVSDYSDTVNYVEWEHEISHDGRNNRLLVVHLTSYDSMHSNQQVEWVSMGRYPGGSQIRFKFLASYYFEDRKVDTFYLLDDQIPYTAGKYYIKAKYQGFNRSISGEAYSYINVSQMAPENVEIFDIIKTANQTTKVTTVTENALTIEKGLFYGKRHNETVGFWEQYVNEIELRGEPGTYEKKHEIYHYNYTETSYKGYAISFRNAVHGTEIPSIPPTEPPPVVLPNFPEGNHIAFEERNISGTPERFGDQYIIHNENSIYLSEDGEEWSAGYSHPKGKVFVNDTDLYIFSIEFDEVTVYKSTDGIQWTDVNFSMPEIKDSNGTYTYLSPGQVMDFAYYVDPVTGQTSLVMIGNVWIVQLDDSGKIKQVSGEEGHVYNLETPINIWFTSPDNGNSWVPHYVDEFFFADTPENYGSYAARKLRKVLSNSNGIYIMLDDQKIFFSSDKGNTWIESLNFEENYKDDPMGARLHYFTDIFVHNNMFIATGSRLCSGINLFWSTDGAYWEQGNIGYIDPEFETFDPITKEYYSNHDEGFQFIAHANNTYATINENTIAESVDGKTWNLYYTEVPSNMLGTYNNRFYRS